MGRAHVPSPIRLLVPVTQGRPQYALIWCERDGCIFVCDMPGTQLLLRPIAVRADLSQTLVKPAACRQQKKWPRKPGPWIQSAKARIVHRIAPVRRNPVFAGSETEMGQVAVADGNAAAGGQKAVDGRHQTAEQGAGGQKADGCSLGHVCPLFLARNHSASRSGNNLCIPDASHNRLVCIAAIGSLHCSKINETGIPGKTSQTAKRPPEPGGLCIQGTRALVLIESEPKL